MIWPRWYKEKFQLGSSFLNEIIYEMPFLGTLQHKAANIAIADNFVQLTPPDDKQISAKENP
jgi:hypothetical protein